MENRAETETSSSQIEETLCGSKDNFKKGILWVIASSFGFALMGVLVRLSGDIDFRQKALFRNSIAFFIALFSMVAEGKKDKAVYHIPKIAWIFLILRSASGSLGIFGNFYAVDRMNISDAAMLNKMSPFFSLLGSFIILKEKADFKTVLILIFAFIGSIFVIKPSFDFTQVFPALVGFIGGAGAGFAYACVRKMHTYNVSGKVIITFFSAFSCILALPYTIMHFQPMSLNQVLCLLGAGCSAALGQFGITNAYFNAPSSKIGVFEYSNIIFSAIMGFFIFDQIPDVYSFIGYAIIITCAAVRVLVKK